VSREDSEGEPWSCEEAVGASAAVDDLISVETETCAAVAQLLYLEYFHRFTSLTMRRVRL